VAVSGINWGLINKLAPYFVFRRDYGQKFLARKSGNQTITTSYAAVTTWTEDVADDAYTFDESTGVLTINAPGWYMAGFDISTDISSGTAVAICRAKLGEDVGAGFVTVDGTEVYTQNETASAGEASMSVTIFRQYEPGDDIEILVDELTSSGDTVVLLADSVFRCLKIN